MEVAAVLRVQRKRGADPAEALLVSCKRLKVEKEEAGAPETGSVTQQLFRLAATISSQEEPVQKYVQEAISRDRAAQALDPSLGSVQRIQKDLRAWKETERQESRYRLISSLRATRDNFDDSADIGQPASPVTDQQPDRQKEETPANEDKGAQIGDDGSFQVLDMVHEEDQKQEARLKESDFETIMCDSVAMIRERLVVSEAGRGSEHRDDPEDFVYDIYYSHTSPHNWIQDILSVQPYSYEQELVAEDPEPEEIYDDEDDENEESNWRNDYPEEEEDSDGEEMYMGYDEDSDGEAGVGGKSWSTCRQKMRELEYDDEEEASD